MLGHKLLFTGSMGAGKTTAISAISEIAPVSTDVAYALDDSSHQLAHLSSKTSTTVALDYGEVTLGSGEKILLYGTPGQARFDFMWEILGQGVLGVVVLLDNMRDDPLADLAFYLDAFSDQVTQGAVVIGVGRTSEKPDPSISKFAHYLQRRDLRLPIFAVDVRRREHVLLLLNALLAMLEARVC